MDTKAIELSTPLKKQRALVEIIGGLKLQERKILNIALRQGQDQLVLALNAPRDDSPIRVRVLTSDVLYFLGVGRNSLHNVKNSAFSLTKKTIRYNVFLREYDGFKKEIMESSSPFFTRISIGKDSCEFSINPDILDVISDETVTAHLDLLEQRKFKSKYAQAIWELCSVTDNNVDKNKYFTEIFSLDVMKDYLGVANSKHYKNFVKLLSQVIKPACEEVSSTSFLNVTPIVYKENSHPTGIYFDVTKGSEILNIVDQTYREFKDTYEYKYLKKLLYSNDRIKSFLNEYGQEFVTNKVKLLESRLNDTKLTPLKSPTSWFENSMDKDYSNPYAGTELTVAAVKTNNDYNKANIEFINMHEQFLDSINNNQPFSNLNSILAELLDLFKQCDETTKKKIVNSVTTNKSELNSEIVHDAARFADTPELIADSLQIKKNQYSVLELLLSQYKLNS